MVLSTFAVTQTIAKASHRLSVFTQLERLKLALKQVMKNMNYIKYYEFTFELTLSNVIHAHGYITCHSNVYEVNKFIYNECSKKIGFCCIKDTKCEKQLEGWITYMRKDLTATATKLIALAEIKLVKFENKMLTLSQTRKPMEIPSVIWEVPVYLEVYNDVSQDLDCFDGH